MVVLGISFQLLSQADRDASYYLDDGGISTAVHTIKTSLTSLVSGNLNLTYDYRLHEFFSLELGMGLQLPYFYSGLYQIVQNHGNTFNDVRGGYNLWLFPKFYSSDNFYVGPLYERRLLQLSDHEIRLNDVSLMIGYQTEWDKWMTIDFGAGIGGRYFNDKLLINEPNNSTIIFPILVQIGRKF